jgi:hypothetical protein
MTKSHYSYVMSSSLGKVVDKFVRFPVGLFDLKKLGEEIGRGAFGCVFKALNLETGDVVAIKQIAIHSIPKEELASIMVGND